MNNKIEKLEKDATNEVVVNKINEIIQELNKVTISNIDKELGKRSEFARRGMCV